jgi:hypothetical protein
MPIDAARVERAVRAQVPKPAKERRSIWRPRLRSMRAIAASLLVVGLLTAVLVLSTSGGPALASPAQMARLHEDLVSGKVAVMQVDSIDAANKALSSQWPEGPGVPGVPENHVMACCMKSVKDKKVACVLLKREGVPVTMTVANASDMQLPTSPTISRNGISYHVQSSGKLNMVMTERQGRWVCLIGALGGERLMDLADQLQF